MGLMGNILCLLAIIPLGFNTKLIPDNLFSAVCAAPNWLLHLGFSLGYGSMFTKIWRVHRIATHTKTKGEDKIKISFVRTLKKAQSDCWDRICSYLIAESVYIDTVSCVSRL